VTEPRGRDRPRLGHRRKLTFALFVAIATLVSAELGARLALALWPQSSSATVDGGWLAGMALDLGAADSAEPLYLPDAELMWRLRPGASLRPVNRVYEMRDEPVRWQLTINDDGHRGPPYPDANSSGPVVLAIGDSCTFGFRVDDDQTWPVHLERELRARDLPGARVVNHGVPGYSSFQGQRLLTRLLDRHRPDVVVIAFGANDHETARQSDAEQAKDVDVAALRLAYLAEHLAVARLARRLTDGGRVGPDVDGPEVRRVSASATRRNLDAMVRHARAAGAKVVLLDLVFIGPMHRYTIRQVARATDVPWLDGRETLRRGLSELEAGARLAEVKRERERFWSGVAAYRHVYFDDAVYERLFADPDWQGLLRYFLVEPVHANGPGNRLIAEDLADRIVPILSSSDYGERSSSSARRRAGRP